ncbi:GGDEF domain-containing protein [Actinoplanes sp. NPDC026670]|uniref:GGDEF domain-containing protein n=1 Tax=Actinoplanes sp. NPDC026670 TaxID=3154700 RepID=UPI0033C040F1
MVAVVWLLAVIGGPDATVLFTNLAQGLTSLYAGLAGVWTATRPGTAGRDRRGWGLLGAGALSWAAGQVIWTWYENVDGVEAPFPSWADAGYLALVPLTVAGAATLIGAHRRAARSVIDGLIITGSLFYLSWALVLGQLYHAGAATTLEWLVTLAYPAGDVVVGSMMFILFARVRRDQRRVLGLLGTGYLALAFADTSFAYLVNSDSYVTSNIFDLGWILGFLSIGAAAGLQRRTAPEGGRHRGAEPRLWVMLPYVPLAAAVTVSLAVTLYRGTVGPMLYVLSTVLVLLVVGRQMLSMRDNQRLTADLHATVRHLQASETALRYSQQQLRKLAYSDALTGLANRAALFERIDTVALAGGPGSAGLLYLDLDGFKQVNDTHGHAVGDALLTAVAHRLLAYIPGTSLAARLGGDEFAVLVTGDEVTGLADQARLLVDAFARPFAVADLTLTVTASLGAAVQQCATLQRSELLRQADIAMYTAKSNGKSRFHISDQQWQPV